MNTLEIYDIAIGIERGLSNMYHRFSTVFKENPEVHNFWAGVASHEKSHSEALTLSKGYLMWNHPSFRHKKAPMIKRSDITSKIFPPNAPGMAGGGAGRVSAYSSTRIAGRFPL